VTAPVEFDRPDEWLSDDVVAWANARAGRRSQLRQAVDRLVAPRVKLVDESRRLVRVLDAPLAARSRPPRILRHYFNDAMYRHDVEPVGVFIGRSGEWDLDYRIVRTGAGDALLAMLRDEVEPSVFMPGRQPRAGAIETTFDPALRSP
jgi:hypothetical protein